MSNSSVQSMKVAILHMMAKVEKSKGKEFHKLYPELDKEIVDAMDLNNMAQLNEVIKKLDDLDGGTTASFKSKVTSKYKIK